MANGNGYPMQAPFPYFGGKSKIASYVWQRFGDVKNYVEPFFGSGAMLLGRPGFDPDNPFLETVNDVDGYVVNFWRSIQSDPESVAYWADWPVSEIDLEARHSWLVNRKERLRWSLADPDFHDPKIAGWWVWGMCSWIGGGFCSGQGPWVSNGAEIWNQKGTDQGINRSLPHLGSMGQGINRKLPHLGSMGKGLGIHSNKGTHLLEWFEALATRFQRVRTCNGDWSRVTGPSVTYKHGLTAVFLDPPYGEKANRTDFVYAEDSLTVADDVKKWAITEGNNPLMRIALCGYTGEHEELQENGWNSWNWKTNGGYANKGNGQGRINKLREIVWFSPHCLQNGQITMDYQDKAAQANA